MRQRFAPSGVIHNCSPPPSESFMIFARGSARLMARSVRAMLVHTAAWMPHTNQSTNKCVGHKHTPADRPRQSVPPKRLFFETYRTNLDALERQIGAQERTRTFT